MNAPPLVYVFTLVFVFAFRESMKTAAAWRAFHGWHNTNQWVRKFLAVSVPLLIVVPIAYYLVARRVLSYMPLTIGTSASLALDALLVTSAAWMGLFPRAAKNLWALVASWQSARALRSGHEEQAWIVPVIGKGDVGPIPHRSYALEVLIVLGFFPILIALFLYRAANRPMAAEWTDATDLLILLYAAQLVVLWHVNKARGFVYRDKRPRHLINGRLSITFVITVLLPILYGVLWYGWLTALSASFSNLSAALILSGFPYYCSGFLGLVARRRKWGDPVSAPEVMSETSGMSDTFLELQLVLCSVCLTILTVIYMLDSGLQHSVINANSAWLRYVSGTGSQP